MQFIEGVGADPEPEGKREKGSDQTKSVDPGRHGRTNRNIRQVPHRVWQMEEREEISQPGTGACIERRS